MGEEREREKAGHLWKDWESEMAQVMLTRKRSKEYNWKRRHYDRARSRTRVNIGNAFQRWRNFKEQEGLKTDAEVALFLLNIKRFSRESCEDWRELDLGLALGGSLRLGEDAVPSPEYRILASTEFSIHPKPKTCREMGCQTEESSTKDCQYQTIHDLKQHSWKLELKTERVFYCFLLLSLV